VTLTLDFWMKSIRSEYLDDFIAGGGSAVKFAVPDSGAPRVIATLQETALSQGYLVASVDAGETKVHLIDQLFYAVSRQITWEALAQAIRVRAINESGYALPGTGPLSIASIAETNSAEQSFVRKNLQQWFSVNVLRDHRMSQEFRQAMAVLCLQPLDMPMTDDGLYHRVLEWLSGDLRLISAVKPAQIYQKITRKNARDLFISLGRWCRFAGRAGLTVIVDIGACSVPKRALAAGFNFYTRPMVVDLYEVLRQFIDDTDDLESLFVAVIAAPEFLADDSRGLSTYDALQMRVSEEVRDRTHDNPLAGLVRLSTVS
jgi:hypothetical protein